MAPSRAIAPLSSLCAACAKRQVFRRQFTTTPASRYAQEPESHLPRIATPSFWSSLIPKPFRRPTDPAEAAARAQAKAERGKEWNPATIFIILGVLVGSNAIQIISLRNEMLNFSRKTDAKLSLLRGVVQRVKNGEDVDVKRALGTGDPQQEAEWEEVIKELEDTDMLAEGRRKRDAQRVEKAEQRRVKDEDARSARAREGPSQSPQSDADRGSAKEQRPKFLM